MDDERLGRPLGDILIEPTEIYVKAVMELLGSPVAVHGLAHLTSGGLDNLLRLKADVAYDVTDPLPPQPIFELIAERGEVPEDEMYEVFNMGCGFCCVLPAADEQAALELLRGHYPGAARIGTVGPGPRSVSRA
jgi:phosphoribosylformylglycinamidine cyclo-ligase